MPGRPTTLPAIQAALRRPQTYDALSRHSQEAVDEMQRRMDAHEARNVDRGEDVEFEPDFFLLRLLRKIERDANPEDA